MLSGLLEKEVFVIRGHSTQKPLSASAGSTALGIVERDGIVETAEKQAVRLKDGINKVLQSMEIPGGAYGVL
ncbi:MAG: hypothetical protein CM1200mP39_08780 [Dehalococcoidia bacterium]|nr:MAG: hypothetical protein CM1200mP39_08780 [Dehalococcoidia bacterium]